MVSYPEVRRRHGDDPVARELVAAIEAEFRPALGPPPGDYNGNPYATFWGEKAL